MCAQYTVPARYTAVRALIPGWLQADPSQGIPQKGMAVGLPFTSVPVSAPEDHSETECIPGMQ